ncbi:SEC-C motif protein [uncultured archaeon]|nr:SEC-C motif protein [uncultured archaeon]
MLTLLSTQELMHQIELSGDRASMELAMAIIARDNEAVSYLRNVLKDSSYMEAADDRRWMPLHAVKLLGTIAYPQAIPELINALLLAGESDDDWILEDLPTAFGRIGPQAIEPLEGFILEHKNDHELWWPRSAAADGLASIAMKHPDENERILSFLHSLFSGDDDTEFLSFVASGLYDMNDTSSVPVLEKAFDDDLIQEDIFSRDDLQDFGKVKERYLGVYDRDLLDFYEADNVAARQARWEKEKKEKERLAAEKREKLEKNLAQEMRRLEAAMKMTERNILPQLRKAGRNDPCPCGSGKKYKKCCLSSVEAIPSKQVLGSGHYADYDYLQRASPYDPVLVLENLTALALQAEDGGDAALAMDIFRKLEPLAERAEIGMLGNLLNYWGDFCFNHREFGEEGLGIIRKRQDFYNNKDKEQWAFAVMDEADYLDLLGRREEGILDYEKLLKEVPGFHWVYIRFARFLERGGRFVEAADRYKFVLEMDEENDSGDMVTVARELKELAAAHGIELDEEVQEDIEMLLEYDI